MKRKALFSLAIVTLLLSSCGRDESGQLIGVQDRPSWTGINPYGMVYVPSGTLTIGQSDQDVFTTHSQRPKAISISGFFMDDTEITNNEYREMVYWVRDSIAHLMMDDVYEDELTGATRIDWEYELDYQDETLEDMFYQGDMRMDEFERSMDMSQLQYTYKWIDWQKAAHNPDVVRTSLLNEETVEVYPDTLVWIRDFAYSYNEPFTRNYFWHPAFDDYPVVGIDWKQARAFAHWRTKIWNAFRGEEPNTEEFRLPTETEWEWAARGGRAIAPYPWGGYYIRNAKGCLLANFKPGRGNYPEDGGFYTVKADAYFPNDYGLYNMSGNVSEWTETSYHPNAYSLMHDLNPDVKYDAKDDDPEAWKRKVIRGGSWKDISYYCQTGTRNWEYQDTNKSYVGFRCALTFLGRSINDF
ncbi:MAG: SUMF1/EgtB/PvdO family nonheme iron enzyme [Saprospiraceae bacterium]|nr:SUMF1/EgtB/PvdO family nonheme iron enzyme [Bacteroidia bacterium]NNE16329.1 SUMF1/EgtB/PvdO family nonheme iron enzyme [Saprospiraceae bacterium]NNL93937.1 SUMF1/EgtB/PvdO family nonheme iron enzyme [Saprospiraceae bacterium]